MARGIISFHENTIIFFFQSVLLDREDFVQLCHLDTYLKRTLLIS